MIGYRRGKAAGAKVGEVRRQWRYKSEREEMKRRPQRGSEKGQGEGARASGERRRESLA